MSIRIRFATLLGGALMTALLAGAGSISAVRAEPPSALFRALEGHWSCVGGFPDGRTLSADLTFTPAEDSRIVRFTHIDRPPSGYWQEAVWAFDAQSNRVFSLSTSGTNANRNVSPALFTARNWTDREITISADSLNGPPWAQNRFTYAVRDTRSLTMRWEIQRGGAWTLGDSLVCSHAR